MTERVELAGSPTVTLPTAKWQADADELRRRLVDEGYDPEESAADMRAAFFDITFRDAAQQSWRHDGTTWWRWDGAAWSSEAPPSELFIASVAYDVEPELTRDDVDVDVDAELPPPAPAPVAQAPYRPTHRAPAEGMPAWSEPDPTAAPSARLDPLLDVQLLERRDNGWAHVRCSNGWEAWVDGRALLNLG